MYTSLAIVAAVVAVVEAYAVPAGHAFQDPKTILGAVRSPCPVRFPVHSEQDIYLHICSRD